ncbi:ATP synthase subunit 4, mitochondrial, partial [Frankliniella fusca]
LLDDFCTWFDGRCADVRIGDLKSCIERTKSNCAKVGTPQQPFPVIVGPKENEITECFVVVDDIKYSLDSLLLAFDCAFMVYQVVNCNYPVQASYSWLFVQLALYKLSAKYDARIPSVGRNVNAAREAHTFIKFITQFMCHIIYSVMYSLFWVALYFWTRHLRTCCTSCKQPCTA